MLNQNQQKSKKKWYNRWWAIIIYIILFIKFVVFISDSQQTQMQSNTISNQPPAQVNASFEVVSEDDTSYADCKRISVKITVPDSYDKKLADIALSNAMNKYKTEWDDITVFAYKNSEKENIKNITYTMGKKEISTCN